MSATLEQIEAKLKNGQNLHAWLLYNGSAKIARNIKSSAYNSHVEKILNFLSNPLSPDGIYQIKCSPIYADKNPETITFIKGEVKSNLDTMQEISKDLSKNLNDEATKLLARVEILEYINANQEAEIKSLVEENENLNAEIEELTEKLKQTATLSEPAETPMQTAKTMFSEILQVGVPLLDKYFQIQEEKNNILKMQQQTARPNLAPPPPQKQPIEKKIEAWINSKANDLDTFENLQAIYYNSDSITKFAELLKEYNENLYNECREAVK